MAEVLARRAEMRKRVGRGEWVGGDSDLVLSGGEGEVGGSVSTQHSCWL